MAFSTGGKWEIAKAKKSCFPESPMLWWKGKKEQADDTEDLYSKANAGRHTDHRRRLHDLAVADPGDLDVMCRCMHTTKLLEATEAADAVTMGTSRLTVDTVRPFIVAVPKYSHRYCFSRKKRNPGHRVRHRKRHEISLQQKMCRQKRNRVVNGTGKVRTIQALR